MIINKKYLAMCLISIIILSLGCIDNTKPQTGTILKRTMYSGKGELTVKNGLTYDAVAVLAMSKMPKVSVLSVYIRSYDSYTINDMSDNNYILYYVIGDDWNKDSRRFMKIKESSRFEDELRYTTSSSYGTIYTATLNPVPEGNATTMNVDEEDFPK